MNERIKQLIELATVRGEEYLPGNDGHPTPTVYFDKEKFAQLLIKEVSAQPKVYLLNVLKAANPDAVWELRGWTSDLKLAQQWREKSSQHERHDFTDLFFVKKIEALE